MAQTKAALVALLLRPRSPDGAVVVLHIGLRLDTAFKRVLGSVETLLTEKNPAAAAVFCSACDARTCDTARRTLRSSTTTTSEMSGSSALSPDMKSFHAFINAWACHNFQFNYSKFVTFFDFMKKSFS